MTEKLKYNIIERVKKIYENHNKAFNIKKITEYDGYFAKCEDEIIDTKHINLKLHYEQIIFVNCVITDTTKNAEFFKKNISNKIFINCDFLSINDFQKKTKEILNIDNSIFFCCKLHNKHIKTDKEINEILDKKYKEGMCYEQFIDKFSLFTNTIKSENLDKSYLEIEKILTPKSKLKQELLIEYA